MTKKHSGGRMAASLRLIAQLEAELAEARKQIAELEARERLMGLALAAMVESGRIKVESSSSDFQWVTTTHR